MSDLPKAKRAGQDLDPAARASAIGITISFGELIDRLTILEIKAERIGDPRKRRNVCAELDLLKEMFNSLDNIPASISALKAQLRGINETLWDLEDRLRDCERRKCFDADFIELARSVYATNDRRAELKRRLNEIVGSELQEEKSYQEYL